MSCLSHLHFAVRSLLLATILASAGWLSLTTGALAAPSVSQIEIDDGGITVEPGDGFAYRITVSSPVTATNVAITQSIQNDVHFRDCTFQAPLTGSCTTGTGSLDLALTTPLLPHAVYTVTTHFTAGLGLTGDIHSGVTMTALDEGGQPLPPASETITTPVHLPQAQIVLSLDNGVTTVQPGETLRYTLFISNTGDATADNLALEMPVPAGSKLVSASDGAVESSGRIYWPAISLAENVSVQRTVELAVVHPLFPSLAELSAEANVTFDGASTPLPTAIDIDTMLSAHLSGLVWHDYNGNGVKEPTESGIGDAVLSISRPDRPAVTQTTAGDGAYDIAGLAAQTYTITVDAGAIPTDLLAVYESDHVVDGQVQVDLSGGVQATPAGFAYAKPATIRDSFAWADSSGDGLFNPEELSLAGIAMTLTYAGFDGALDTADDVTLSTQTTGDGEYEFPSLAPGRYRLVVDEASVPAGYAKSIYPQGSTDGVLLITLLSNQVVTGLNYGFNVLDLSVYKHIGGIEVTTSTLVPYEIIYINDSQVDADQVRLTEFVPVNSVFVPADSHPDWHCLNGQSSDNRCDLVLGALPAGESGSLLFVVQVADAMPAHANALHNTVQIADDLAQTADPTAENNRFRLATAVEAEPALVIFQSDGGTRTEPGNILRYTMDYANEGNQDASGVVISMIVPANTRFSAASSSPGWQCAENSPAGSECLFPVGLVAAGGGGSIDFAMTVDFAMPVNVATINAEVVIRDDRNHQDSDGELTPIDAAPDLILTDSQDVSVVYPGTVIRYTLDYINAGNRDAIGVLIVETIPRNTRFDEAASTPGWDCPDGAEAGESCIFVVGALPAGESGDIHFAVRVDDDLTPAVDSIQHDAVIAGSGIELDIRNNSASSSVQLQIPTVVDLLSFTATAQEDDTLLVEWRTGAERNSWGFLLYRSTDTNWEHSVPMMHSLLPSTGDENSGTTYNFVDGMALEGIPYYYWLHELEYSGHTNIYGPIEGHIGAINGGHTDPRLLPLRFFAPLAFR